MKNIHRIIAMISILLLVTLISCDSEIGRRYTPKNMLIGAAIGVGIVLLFRAVGMIFPSGQDDFENKETEDKEIRDSDEDN